MRSFPFILVFLLCFAPFAGVQAQVLTGNGNGNVFVNSEFLPVEDEVKPFPNNRVPDLPGPQGDAAPVDFEADSLTYDETGEVVIALGNVIIVQDGRILRADEVRYTVAEDTVEAHGNVVLNEANGDIHFSQSVTFNNRLKDGFVEGLESQLVDASRFTSARGRREGGNKTIMADAAYTPCELCKAEPDRAPLWQIRAAEVEHDAEAAQISYRHARFEVAGVPVAYLPYFSHPDGSIDQKSGFLAPSLGYKSDFGAFAENSYYWAIGPDQDATFSLITMTEQAPLGSVEYRKRWDDASLTVDAGVTYSERTDEVGEDDFTVNEEFRGHLFADALWDIDDKWRAGLDVEYVTDDQYASQYDVSSEDVLENRFYVERFSGRDYASVNFSSFDDIRNSDLEVDQPEVLPEMFASFIGDPGGLPVLKGRWDATVSSLNLLRDGDGQDVTRLAFDAGWKRRLVSDFGFVSDLDLSLREDFYYVNDSTTGDTNSKSSRFYPQFHMQSSYPVAKMFENSQLVIEPIIAATFAPDIDEDDDLPNEDSQDVQLDASNLFEANRFSGLDAVEDGSRVTYGTRVGLQGFDGSSVEGFLGQSYRFNDDEDDNPFSAGSGLDEQESDIVGYVNASVNNTYKLGYRFQLDNDTFASGRHELDAEADWNRFRLDGTYLYAKALDGTEIIDNREQAQLGASYYLNDEWRAWTSAQYDLGVDEGLRKAQLGLDYFGQCVSWSVTGVRNYTDDASGDSDTEILFRIGLKNLGEFAQSGLRDVSASE